MYKYTQLVTTALKRADITPRTADPKKVITNCQAELPSTAAALLLAGAPVLEGSWFNIALWGTRDKGG